MQPKHRTEHQRRAYAMRRLTKAVDRTIFATSLVERIKASYWADAWAVLAGVRSARRD